MKLRLGKLPPKVDSRTYLMKAPLAKAMPVIPRAVNWCPTTSWPMWANDVYGCCTQVGVASAIKTWTGAAQSPVELKSSDVLSNYSARTGFNIVTGQPDLGDCELDVLNFWRTTGFNRPGQTKDYLTAYGSIDPTDQLAVQRSIAYLGGVYLGLSLPKYAVSDLTSDWTYTKSDVVVPVGGHCVWAHGYNADWVFINTWGQRRRMSWAFMRQFCDEAYSLVSRQNWIGVNGKSPNGEAVNDLIQEMKSTVL